MQIKSWYWTRALFLMTALFLLFTLGLLLTKHALIFILIGFVVLAVLWLVIQLPEIFLILAIWTNILKAVYIPLLEFRKYGLTPFMLFTILSATGFSIQILLGKRRFVLPPGVGLLAVFMIGTTLTSLLVQNPSKTLGAYIRDLLQWVIFFLLIQVFSNRKQALKYLKVFLFQAVVVVLWGFVTGIQLNFLGFSRSELLFWNQLQKNEHAIYLGFVLVFCLANVQTQSLLKNKITKLTSWLLILLVPFAWVFTFSRSGLLGIVTAFVVYMALDRNRKLSCMIIRWMPIILLLVIIGAITFSFQAERLIVEGVVSIFQPDSTRYGRQTENIYSRMELLRVAGRIILKHPLIGIDYSQWISYTPIKSTQYDPQLGERVSVGVEVHNRYLQIAVQSGLVTLFSYLGFLFYSFRMTFFTRHTADPAIRSYLNAALAGVAGYMVSIMFVPKYLWEWPILGLMLGLVQVVRLESPADRNHLGAFITYRLQWRKQSADGNTRRV